MKKYLIILPFIVGNILTGIAQNEIDALRYSLTNYEGTARFMAMGGAFGAIGGDLSAIGVNPASMGRFSKNEFSFSLGGSFSDTRTMLYNNSSTASRSNINIPNVGFVGTHNFKHRDKIGWQSVQFGISYNRLNNFNENITIQGNTPNSYSLVFADWAQGTIADNLISTNNYDSYLAYETWLIDPNPSGSTDYVSTIRGGTNALKTISRKGNMSSTELALSGNYMNKLYIGGSLGIPTLRFDETASHFESVTNDTVNQLDNFTYTQTLKTTGTGFNLKLGFVALPMDWFRFGASIQTPTAFRMSDRWQNAMVTNFDDGARYEATSDPGSYVYKLRTPLKVTGSAAFVLFKKAVFSIDYELLDYSKSRLGSTSFSTSPYNFNTENETIGSIYNRSSSIRIGAELKVAKPLLIRGGAQYRQNPLIEAESDQLSYSFGFGYRVNKFYLDLAYVLTTTTENYFLYDPVLVEGSDINKSLSRAVVTLGFRY